MSLHSSGPDPEDIIYDEDSGLYVDSNSDRTFYDADGKEPADDFSDD